MDLVVNGKKTEVGECHSVAQLVAELELTSAVVAVELNRRIIPRRQHETTTLSSGDEVEIVTLVGGGT